MAIKQIPQAIVPASVGGMTLISTTSLSGTSVTISSISGSYKNLYIIGRNVSSSVNDNVRIRLNSDSGSNYSWNQLRINGSTLNGDVNTADTNCYLLEDYTTNTFSTAGFFELSIPRYTESELKSLYIRSMGANATLRKANLINGTYNSTSAISSLTIYNETGTTTFSTGTVYVYGVN